MPDSKMGRRDFLGLLGGVALLGPVSHPVDARQDRRKPDLEIVLRAAPDDISILPGTKTRVWRFHAKVIGGKSGAVDNLPGTYSGPIIRVNRGDRVRIHFRNDLPQPSIVHWHGLIVPDEMDGHPRYAVPPGGSYEYDFVVDNRAGTYWFHPHPHGLTGPQVFAGLAGLFIVSDEEERALGLPEGEDDIPLILQDRSFTIDNQMVYLNNGGGMMGMMGGMMGYTGDRILVNGRPGHELSLHRRAYRLRVLNGSNSRIYKLAWQDGTPMTVIGSDGGLLAAPVSKPYVTLAPAERVELWVDLSNRRPGEVLVLNSLPFAAGGGGPMMGGMMRGRMGGGMPNGAGFQVLSVRVGDGARKDSRLPERLASIPPVRLHEAINRNQPRTIEISAGHMVWGLNGRVFEMNGVAADEIVRLGSTETWEIINDASMGMMGGMPHPVHVHGVQFRVVGRRIRSGLVDAWKSVRDGYVDEGWKDTVLIMPGERVQIMMRFDGHPGTFLYHCHNLEHEDMGMMRNFMIRA